MSEHFSLEELLYSDTAISNGIANSPSWDAVNNLMVLAAVMEQVRSLLGDAPVEITSAYRCPDVNRLVGGAADSAHLHGLACDFVVEGLSPLAVCQLLEPYVVELGIDQLIHEYGDWVHLGLSVGEPRGQCLTIDSGGTITGFA